MKFLTFLMTVVFVSLVSFSKAQTSTTSFSDEDLKNYAITMDSVEGMTQTLNATITEMVQKNTVMTVPRYNELFKIADDQNKLTEAKATPEEVAFVKQVADKRKEETAKINTNFQALVKEKIGVMKYNAIKKSLESDANVKAKYESISNDLNTKGGK
jgi:hypothetical protein